MSLRRTLVALAVLVALHAAAPAVHAWGHVGHSLTGRVAMQLVSDTTKRALAGLLPAVHGDISLVSSWADEVKRSPRYAHTGPLHYSDAHDDPPHACSYVFARDCPDGNCVIAAIKDFTAVLAAHRDRARRAEAAARRPRRPRPAPAPQPKYTPVEAIKFLVHLVQDVHQPMHLTGRLRGGNDAPATFDGQSTNLHVVWDSLMLEKALHQDYRSSEVYLAQVLLAKTQLEWRPEAKTWTTCPAPAALEQQHPLGRLAVPVDLVLCPEYWAKGIDMLNCNNVWAGYSESRDLGGAYYEENVAAVLKSVAMGGVRLAALLEAIFNPARQ